MDLDPRPRPAVPTALTDYVDQQFALFRDNWDHLDLTGGREDPYIEAATDASIAIEEHLDFLQSTEPAEHLAAADRYRQALFQWHNDFTCVRTIAAEKTKTPIRTRSQEQLDASFRSAKAVVEEAEARMRLTRQQSR